MASSGLLQQISVFGRAELRDPCQGDAHYHPRTGRVEAFPGGSLTSGGDLDRPQEPEVLHNS